MSEHPQTIAIDPAPLHPSKEQLRDFALGKLSGEEILQCSSHLETCHDCQALVESFPNDRMISLLGSAGVKGSAPSARRLLQGYEILEEIGRGGMAIVYKARQADLGRIVAFKQIREEYIFAEGLARFRSEATAMASLKHPNIVQIFDVGEQEGRPYLACELVRGGGLDKSLSGNPLPLRSACRLVATLARAMQVAHDLGIIHRDLKPSNVLLDVDDSKPAEPGSESFWEHVTPKIGDFGLAKNLHQVEGLTHTGALLGTPGYMAPEQASGKVTELSAAVDIFSLGVIFYELLAGRRPFQSATLVETLELIRTADPLPPSHGHPRTPRDLDVICLKCLEKEPRRRYASAGALADDLERWLAGVPIHARPTPFWERVFKWSRRHPARATLVAGGAIALISLVSGVLWHNHELRLLIKRADHNESVALTNYLQSRDKIMDFVEDPLFIESMTPTVKNYYQRLMASANEYLSNALEGADESSFEVRLAKACVQVTVGALKRMEGDYDSAMLELDESIEKLEVCRRQAPDREEIDSYLAMGHFSRGYIQFGHDQFSEAESELGKSLELLEGLLRSNPHHQKYTRRAAFTYLVISSLHAKTGDMRKQRQTCQRGLELWQDLLDHHSPAEKYRRFIALECNALADSYFKRELWDEADQVLKAGESTLCTPDGEVIAPFLGDVLGWNLYRQSLIEFHRQEYDKAIALCERAVHAVGPMLEGDSENEKLRYAVQRFQAQRSELLSRSGRADEARQAMQESLKFAKEEEKITAELRSVAELIAQQQTDEAEKKLAQFESVLSAALERGRGAGRLFTLAEVYFRWGELEVGRGKIEEVIRRYEQSLLLLEELLKIDPRNVAALQMRFYTARLKAWHSSRAGFADRALAAWGVAVDFASGDSRAYTLAERSLELSLLGKHELASEDADQASGMSESSDATRLFVVTAYSRVLAALESDSTIDAADRRMRAQGCVDRAMACLRSISVTFLTDPKRIQQLSEDPAFSPLRGTPEFKSWFEEISTSSTIP